MSKKSDLIDNVKSIISRYNDKMTLRQIYYQLVSHYSLENTKSNYKQLSAALVAARNEGSIEYEDIEDKTRNISNLYYPEDSREVPKEIHSIINYVFNCTISLPEQTYQPVLNVFAVEKAALQSLFERNLQTNRNNIILINRGYNSLTQIYELAEYARSIKAQKICVLYFGDFDPSGFDIERSLIERLKKLIDVEVTNERVALTDEQIKKYNLPTAIPKTTDTRTKDYQYKVSVELDALDINVLKQLIIDHQDDNLDQDILTQVQEYNIIRNRRFRKNLNKRLLEKIKSGDY
jgi:hypothetical protein